ncbi:MAG: hypothetical protein IJ880_00075 [Bacilli bacterium]|nr:hypothetical protein [Bacilli bacterium]
MVDFIAEVLKENDLFKECEIIIPKRKPRKIKKYVKEEIKLRYVERKITLGVSLGDMLKKSTNEKGQIVFKIN